MPIAHLNLSRLKSRGSVEHLVPSRKFPVGTRLQAQHSRAIPAVPAVALLYVNLGNCVHDPQTFAADIDCGVYIAVVVCPAVRTRPLPNREVLHGWVFLTARGADLAACKRSPDKNYPFAVPLCFVLEFTPELIP